MNTQGGGACMHDLTHDCWEDEGRLQTNMAAEIDRQQTVYVVEERSYIHIS